MGILSGLEKIGLADLEKMDIFGDDKEEALVEKKEPPKVKKEEHIVTEDEMVYEKKCKCVVCDSDISYKIVKTGKARLIGVDKDLRPRHEGIDINKYDVIACENCGYAALTKYYKPLLPTQIAAIKENITLSVRLTKSDSTIYSYDLALERYQLALACSMVRRARNSEKAFICLKTAWVIRGYYESLLNEDTPDMKKVDELKATEKEYLANAYKGFLSARENEMLPIAGMDAPTFDYLLAQLGVRLKDYDKAAKLVSSLLVDKSISKRMKDGLLELKAEIINARQHRN